jgi:hypothetical protein
MTADDSSFSKPGGVFALPKSQFRHDKRTLVNQNGKETMYLATDGVKFA